MELVPISTKVVKNVLVNERRINRMEKVKRFGQMVRIILECIKRGKRMDKVSLYEWMERITKESFEGIILRALGCMSGRIRGDMKESERRIGCMEKGCFSGLMVGNI